MILSKLTLLIFIFNIGFTAQVEIQCSNSFGTGNDTDFCYYYKKIPLSWVDAYNLCLTRTADGILMQIFSIEQFNLLKNADIDGTSLIWLGANNFASFNDFKWRWIGGSIVDDSVITWCENSTYQGAIGTNCAAYDSTLQCVNNYQCDTLLPAPCVSMNNEINTQGKSILTPRQTTSTYICSSTYGSPYAYWWTYSSLLLNWFILFCFFLYLCNRFILNKNTIILTASIVVLSFILIIIYAILWGVQYNDILGIPLAIVIIGSLANAFLLIVLLIILSDRTRVRHFMLGMIFVFLTILLECFFMLGLILSVAYCSGFITLTSTSIDKDIISSLLASLTAAISILFYTAILYVLETTGLDRANAVRPAIQNAAPMPPPPQPTAPPRPPNSVAPAANHRQTPVAPVKKHEHVHRATSPVDERILNEFYADAPKDVHQYKLEGRQYVVYEGADLTDIETYRKELTQGMLLQDPGGLHEAIDRAKNSIHASALAEEIQQAEGLVVKMV